MVPYYADDQITLHQGDALDVLSGLPAGSVDCCVTSPPYYGLRDYGVPGQYGLEPSPAAYVETMRAVFAQVRRVLADDGTCWLNLGDSFVGNGGANRNADFNERWGNGSGQRKQEQGRPRLEADEPEKWGRWLKDYGGLPVKNLLGMPWRVAFALQADDSGDIYELMADAPEAIYLETCRIRTQKHGAHTTANTPSDGARNTQSSTRRDARNGTQPTPTSSAPTAGSTTNSTASRRSFDRSEETPNGIGGSDSQHSSTTAESNPSAHVAESGGSHSSPSTTSTVAVGNIAESSGLQASPSGNTYGESPTRPDSGSSATTATRRAVTTDRARTRMRLPKHQIPPDLLPFFRLVNPERWILRNAIVWDKPNAMPESVTDRLSTTYELVFLLAKSRRYRFDLDAVREPHDFPGQSRTLGAKSVVGKASKRSVHERSQQNDGHPLGRNPGDVWTLPTQPFPKAHFAVMAPELARRCIVAGCKPGGVVLDPFCGSGTTGMVAQRHGRRFVGIDLNTVYLDLALRTRLAQTAILDEVG